MKPSKRLAAGMAVALVAGAAVSVMSTGTAQAAPTNINCGTANGVSPSAVTSVDLSVTVSPATANIGDNVTVTVTNATPYLKDASAPTIGAQSTQVVVNVQVGNTNRFITGPVNPTSVTGTNAIFNGWTAIGANIPVSGPGLGSPGLATTVSLREFYYDAIGSGGLFSTGAPGGVAANIVAASPPQGPADFLVTERNRIQDDSTPGIPSGFDVICNGSTGDVRQTAVVGAPTATSATATLNVIGPNAAVSDVIGQDVTTHARPGDLIVPTGSLWNTGAFTSITIGSNNVTAAAGTTLAGDAGGLLTGNIDTTGVTPGVDKTVTLTQGTKSATFKISILNPQTVDSPASVSAGLGATVNIALQTNSWDPAKNVTASDGTNSGSTTATTGLTTGGGGSISLIIGNASATQITVTQGAVVRTIPLTVLRFKCYAVENGLPGTIAPGVAPNTCEVEQTVEISITPGDLAQRHYLNNSTVATNQAAAPAAASSAAAVANADTPTKNTNQGNQNVNLGSIQTPLIATNVFGVMNDITVTDTRGGQSQWTLSATMSTLQGVTPANKINASALQVSTTCATATAATAWDYENTAFGKVAISGYVDPWASRIGPDNSVLTTKAAGLTPVSSLTPFANNDGGPAVNLCTKNTSLNNYGTTGGVFNVTGNLRLTVPAFQAIDRYTGVMTVTLA